MTMYLLCSADIWHSKYLWCFSLWLSQIKPFIYEDRLMQDFIIVHWLNSEKVYSNIGLLSNCAEVYISSVHTFILYLLSCLQILLETVKNYFLPVLLKKKKTHLWSTPPPSSSSAEDVSAVSHWLHAREMFGVATIRTCEDAPIAAASHNHLSLTLLVEVGQEVGSYIVLSSFVLDSELIRLQWQIPPC